MTYFAQERKAMINKDKIVRFLSLSLAVAGLAAVCGLATEANAQGRDPFAKPGWARKSEGKPGVPGKYTGPPVNLGVPGIEQRIEFYKRLRESAAVNGQRIPKVTSVLTLNEMAVTGIFRTPRGYAAMVEATPIKLSYTIYPGEKFFDGQLVAVEENKLVFRRITKMSNGKFVSSVENKTLRKYTDREVVQGTAPVQGEAQAEQPAPTMQPVQTAAVDPNAPPVTMVSPLEEMNKQMPADTAKGKDAGKGETKKPSRKPAKVARNK